MSVQSKPSDKSKLMSGDELRELLRESAMNLFFGKDYKVVYHKPVTPQDLIMSTSTFKPRGKGKNRFRQLVFSEPANIKCDQEKTPKFVRIDAKTNKEIKKVPFFGYMQPNVVDGRIGKNDDKSVYCKNASYPYLTWDNSKYKYCCSETPDTLEKKLKHCKDVLYDMFTGISNHKKKNPGRSTDQQFLNTIKLYMNIFRQIMQKKLQDKIQSILTTPEQQKEISVFTDLLNTETRTEEERLDNLYKINLTEDTELSEPDTSEVARFIASQSQDIPPVNYLPPKRFEEYEKGWRLGRTDPTTNMTYEERDEYLKNYAEFDKKYFSGKMVPRDPEDPEDPETKTKREWEWVFNTRTGGTRKRKPCNRRKKTRRKGSKRMKKKNKAGKLKHSHKLRKLH